MSAAIENKAELWAAAAPRAESINSSCIAGVCRLHPCIQPHDWSERNPHLAMGPALEIGHREAFEKWVCFYDLLALGSATGVGTCHDRGGIGILQRREDGDRARSAGKMGQVECGGRYG